MRCFYWCVVGAENSQWQHLPVVGLAKDNTSFTQTHGNENMRENCDFYLC